MNLIAQIPLGKAKVKVALVDSQDYPRVAAFRWSLQCGGKYVGRHVGGRRDQRMVYLHRFILGLMPADGPVDHANGNGLDNRRVNLRLCDRSANMRNMRLHGDSRSGLKGVTFAQGARRSKPWKAQIFVSGKNCHLGSYATARDAAIAYDEAAIRSFGEFALTNERLGLL